MIISHAALNGIQISACELMTKWDKARTHTHKLTIKESQLVHMNSVPDQLGQHEKTQRVILKDTSGGIQP